MIELVEKWLELEVKRNWLRCIDKAVNKHNRLNTKAKAQAYVVHQLVRRYNEIYGEEIMVKQPEAGADA